MTDQEKLNQLRKELFSHQLHNQAANVLALRDNLQKSIPEDDEEVQILIQELSEIAKIINALADMLFDSATYALENTEKYIIQIP
jgi:hypothetical protein